MTFLFKRSKKDIQLWYGLLTGVLFSGSWREPNQTWQNWVGLLELQRDQRKSTCIIKEKHLIGGEIKVILLVRLEAWKKRGNCVRQDPPRADAKIGLNMLTFYQVKQLLEKIWREPKKAGRAFRPQCKSDSEWKRGKEGWVQTSLTAGQSKECLARLSGCPQARVRCQRSWVS